MTGFIFFYIVLSKSGILFLSPFTVVPIFFKSFIYLEFACGELGFFGF